MNLPIRRRERTPSETRAWDPATEFDQLKRQITSLFDSWRHLPDLVTEGFTPLADVEESPDAYVVEIELAGVTRDDIDIDVSGRRLSVRGERKEKERVGFLRRKERTVGRFSYEVTLPGELDEDGVEANLDHGVLTVRLPKSERDRPRRIPIR